MAVIGEGIMLPDKDMAIYKCKCGNKIKIENNGTNSYEAYCKFEGQCILMERLCKKCGEALELQNVIPSKETISNFNRIEGNLMKELINKDESWQSQVENQTS